MDFALRVIQVCSTRSDVIFAWVDVCSSRLLREKSCCNHQVILLTFSPLVPNVSSYAISVIEFIATTLFVFNGCLSAVSTGKKLVGQGGFEDVARIFPIAFTFGISIMTLAYAIGHITGGHMNPAVSFLMFCRRKMSFGKMICYWGAQLVGALFGAALLWGCSSSLAGLDKGEEGTYQRPPFNLGATTLDSTLNWGNGFLLEFMGSFFFFFVIAQTALDKKGIAESFFPAIPIGFSLIVVHIGLIPFTGCGVNPARTFGPSMVVCMSGEIEACEAVVGGGFYWVYYIAPMLAALAVSEVTLLMEIDVSGEDKTPPKSQTINEARKTPENKTLELLEQVRSESSLHCSFNAVLPPMEPEHHSFNAVLPPMEEAREYPTPKKVEDDWL